MFLHIHPLVFFRILLIILAIIALTSEAAAQLQRWSFPLSAVQPVVIYRPGGQTAAQVQRQTGGRLVIPGGYFGLKNGQVANVDLTIVNGRKIAPYRRDCARPILALAPGRAAIFGSYASFAPHAQKFPFVLAGDSVGREKTRRCWRSIVGIKKGRLIVLRLYASHRLCLQRLKALGIGKYLFMDGGTSLAPGAKSPSHIVIFNKKPSA
jgi:hypothetical protein